MSAGVAVKRSQPPRHLDVHPSVSCDKRSDGEEEKEGNFMFGSLRRSLQENGAIPPTGCPRVDPSQWFAAKDEAHAVESMENEPSASISEKKFEDDLQQRLRTALQERDDQWKEHEKGQIRFLQEEHDFMLKFLHKEVERLRHSLREAQKPLVTVESGEEKEKLRKRVEEQEELVKQLKHEIKLKEEQTTNLEAKVALTIERLREQNELQSDRIRQLSSELNDRNQTVTHLSAQLRSYRLRDAMATAQQRRRASQGSPIVSPTSPHRVFPPAKGLVTSSITVTYPGSKSSMSTSSGDSLEGPGSIERPPRRRSSSGFGK